MTRDEYKAKLKGLHPQMDCDLEWKYTQEYITSLEAWIAELEAALDKAASYLYEATGSCPKDLYDWEQPNTCACECAKYDNADEAWKCWWLWLMCPDPQDK